MNIHRTLWKVVSVREVFPLALEATLDRRTRRTVKEELNQERTKETEKNMAARHQGSM
jgi:hypothetical protein